MTTALNGVQTSDSYPQGNTGGVQIGPIPRGQQLDLVVGNAAAAVELWYPEPGGAGALGGAQLTDEFIVVAGSGQIQQASYKNCIGFKARSFKAGTPATVYATLWETGDPVPLGGSSYSGTLSSSGSGPGVAQIGFQHNDVLVGNEAAVDFEDGGGVTWTLTDDPANSRMKVAAVAGGGVTGIARVNGWFGGGSSVSAQSLISGGAASGTTGFSIPGGTMGIKSMLHLVLAGQTQNAGGAANATLAVVLGGVTLLSSQQSHGANTPPILLDLWIATMGATNAITIFGKFKWNINDNIGADFSGNANVVTSSDTEAVGIEGATQAINMANPQHLDVTWQGNANLHGFTQFASLDLHP